MELYGKDVDLLFISTLHLPIANLEELPSPKKNLSFNNYVEGSSPRKRLDPHNF